MTARLSAIALLTGEELARLFQSARGILFVAMVGLTAFASAGVLDAFIGRVADETGIRIDPGTESRGWSAEDLLRGRLDSFAEGRPLVTAVLRRKMSIPGALLAWIYGFVLPWLIIIAGHARICEDRQSGYARFVFMRIHRSSYVLGKLLALWGFAAGVAFAGLVGHALWWRTQGAETLAELPALGLRTLAFCLPYVSATLLASTVTRSNVAALSIATAVIFGGGLVFGVADGWFGAPWAGVWFGQWSAELWSGSTAAFAVFGSTGALFAGAAVGLLVGRDA